MSLTEALNEANKVSVDTQMPLFEGYRVSEHRLVFSGHVKVVEPELLKALKLGAEDIAFVVRGRVQARGHKIDSDKEGNLLGVTSSSTLLVESVSGYEEPF